MSQSSEPKPDRIMRLPQVKDATGLSKTTIYRRMADGQFPPKIRLGENSTGWWESDIMKWQANPRDYHKS